MSSSAAEMISHLKINQRKIKEKLVTPARFLELADDFQKMLTIPIENIRFFERPPITPTVQNTLRIFPPIGEACIVTLNSLTYGASPIEGLEALNRIYRIHHKLLMQRSKLKNSLKNLMNSLPSPNNACQASRLQKIKVIAYSTQIINGLLHGSLSALGAYTSFKHNTLNRAGIIFELAQFHKAALLCKIGNFAISSNVIAQILSSITNYYSVYNGLTQTNGGKDIYDFVKDCIIEGIQLLPKSENWPSGTFPDRAFQYGILQTLIDQHIDKSIQELIFTLANGLDKGTQAIINVTGPLIASTIFGEPYGLPVLPTQCPVPPVDTWPFRAQPNCPSDPLEHGHFGSIELGINKLMQDILLRTLGIVTAKRILAPFVGGWVQGLSLSILQAYQPYLQASLKQQLLRNIEGFLFNCNENIQKNKEGQEQIEAGKNEAKEIIESGRATWEFGQALFQCFTPLSANNPTPIEPPKKTCTERFSKALDNLPHDVGNFCGTWAYRIASLAQARLNLGHKRNTRLTHKYCVVKKPDIESRHESPGLEAPLSPTILYIRERDRAIAEVNRFASEAISQIETVTTQLKKKIP